MNEKLSSQLLRKTSDPARKEDIPLRHLMGDIRAELKSLNGTQNQQVRAISELTTSVQELSSSIKSFTPRIEGALQGVASCLSMTHAARAEATTTDATAVDGAMDFIRQGEEFDREWGEEKERRMDNIRRRSPAYLHHHTPLKENRRPRPVEKYFTRRPHRH